MKKVDVAVVGGGPGGLAAAHGILRANPRAKVTVLEKRPSMIPMGAGLVVLPNGLTALSAVSPEAFARVQARNRVSLSTTVVDGVTGEERVVHGNPMSDKVEQEYGIRPVTLGWFQLQEDLAQALPSKDILRLGSSVTSMEQVGDAVKHKHRRQQ